ncbi:MAG: hypothetical protein M3433_00270 [Actinomycetota bacterium]|nr:hypothetical protein [Actinomycetota bacterium]
MSLASAGATFVLRLWRADLSVPIDDRHGDQFVYLMWLKGMLEHGWTLVNPSLGAPFAQENYDFPIAGTSALHFSSMKAIGVAVGDAPTVMNIYFLLGFPLAALVMFLVLRRFGISPAVAVVCSTLFALLPDHFNRGEAHLVWASYFVIPLVGYLLLSLLAGDPLFTARASPSAGRLRRWLSRRSLATLALCVLIGAADFFYTAFAVMLIFAAACAGSLIARQLRPLAVGALLALTIGATQAVQLAPSVLYTVVHGGNPAVAQRSPAESELFSLNLTHLVLPIHDHRLKPFADLERKYTVGSGPPPFGSTPIWGTGPMDHLGLIGAIALLGLLGLTIVLALDDRSRRLVPARLRHTAGLTTIALLISTTGGVSALIALLVTPKLRTWDVMSIVIAFFCLFAVALGLDAMRRRWQAAGRNGFVFVSLLAAILVLGALDQTSDSFVPHYKREAALAHSTSALVASVERSLPSGSKILQLPYEVYPEPPPSAGTALKHDSALPYLYSKRLRWSYGAMVGRPEDWAAKLKGMPPQLILPNAAGAGFSGIWIDRFGLADRGRMLEVSLTRAIGNGAVQSRDGRYAFFDIRAYKRRLQTGDTGPDGAGRGSG